MTILRVEVVRRAFEYFMAKKCTRREHEFGSSKLYTCSTFPLEIISGAKSTVYVHTTFLSVERTRDGQSSSSKERSKFSSYYIHKSETYIFYRDHYTKITNRESESGT